MSSFVNTQWVTDQMLRAVQGGVQTTANAIKFKAKKYAPVRKIFKERGAARIETRRFRTQSKNGRYVTREVSVRTHQANRYSSSKLARQAFGPATSKDRNPIQFDRYNDSLVRFLHDTSPDAKGRYSGQLSSRGRWEVAHMAKGYEYGLTQSPGLNAPEGRKASATKTGHGTSRRTTLIRVRNEKNIRMEVAFGILGRRFGREMSPYEAPNRSGTFHGAVLDEHYQLQVGGALRDSITTHDIEAGNRERVRVETDVPYAVHQEFGTKHNPAHPFMRPALFEHAGQLQRNVANRAKKRFKG